MTIRIFDPPSGAETPPACPLLPGGFVPPPVPIIPVPVRRRAPLVCDDGNATACQKTAFAALSAFIDDPVRRGFLLCGYAGTGKTWTTEELARALLRAGYDVVLVATTNKAVRVLKAKAPKIDCPQTRAAFAKAQTVSRFLHRKIILQVPSEASAREQQDMGLAPDAEVSRHIYIPAGTTPGAGTVVILDEASMLSPDDADLMVERCLKVVFVGDRLQLPPVGVPSWLDRQVPDAELTEVVRQKTGSGIPLLGQKIRTVPHCDGLMASRLDGFGQEVIDLRIDFPGSWYGVFAGGGFDAVDMILAHRNVTCGAANVLAVQDRFPGWRAGEPPPIGSRLFSHEAYVVQRGGETEVVVGKACQLFVREVLGEVHNGPYAGWKLRLWNEDENREVVVPCLQATFVSLDYQKTARALGSLTHGMAEIGFGYALTVHKSQGSEWPTVLLIDEFGTRGGEQFRRWVYTGVTRAKTTLLYWREKPQPKPRRAGGRR